MHFLLAANSVKALQGSQSLNPSISPAAGSFLDASSTDSSWEKGRRSVRICLLRTRQCCIETAAHTSPRKSQRRMV